MWRLKNLRNHRRKTIILGLLIFGWWILGPTAKWLWPTNWWGTSVIVLMNENEARPCGGFVTAYGVLKLPLFSAELKNSFAFPDHQFGENSEPLRQVSAERKFWDLADTMNPKQCGAQFKDAYESVADTEINRVILVQAGLVETWLQALGGIKLGDQVITQNNWFAYTSRLVADVDRHDEQTLLDRKSPLGTIGKRMVVKTIFQPWKWHRVTRAFGKAQDQGQLYWHSGSEREPTWAKYPDQLIAVTEWNLGGGKSSRYLDKRWTVRFDQQPDGSWAGNIKLNIDHLGGTDVPLSQTWKGVFELRLLGDKKFVEAEIKPGTSFAHEYEFELDSSSHIFTGNEGKIPTDWGFFTLYAPASQDWKTSLQLSALGQQMIGWNRGARQKPSLNLRDNTASWRGGLPAEGARFRLSIEPDKAPPFLVWHKPLSSLGVDAQTQLDLEHQGSDTIVELQFNELVKLDWPSTRGADGQQIFVDPSAITLNDRNYEVKNYTENPRINRAVLLPDQRTLLLNLQQERYQTNERFYLKIDGVADRWGNVSNIKNRTVITR